MTPEIFYLTLGLIVLLLIGTVMLNKSYYCYQYDKTKVYSDLGYNRDMNGSYYTSIHSECDTKLNWLYNVITTHDNGEKTQ